MNKLIGFALMLPLACAFGGQSLPSKPLPGQAQQVSDDNEAAALDALRAAPDQVEPYIRLAAINDRRGKLHISRNYLLRALELAPEHSGVHHLLSVNYARIEDWEKAFVHMETALKSEPRNAAIRYNAGNLFHNTGKFLEASEQYRLAHLLDPANFQYHFLLALATELADQREEALAEWTKVIEAHPGKAGPYSRRATLMMSLGRKEEAHRDAAKAISLDLNSADAHYVLGRIHEQDRELPKALEAYAQVVAIDPEHIQTRYRLSLVQRRSGDAEEANKQSNIYRLLKARNDALDTVARATNSLATGNYRFAETQLREAVRIDPENVQALYHLGMVQQEQHKFADAVKTFQTVLSLDPELAMARATLGLALAELGRREEARHELGKSLELSDASYEVAFFAGRGFLRLEDFARAETALVRALDLWPSHPKALASTFELYVMWDKTQRARAYADLAAEANPTDAKILFLVGLFWAGEGEFERARSRLQRATTALPGDKNISDLLAQVDELIAQEARGR